MFQKVHPNSSSTSLVCSFFPLPLFSTHFTSLSLSLTHSILKSRVCGDVFCDTCCHAKISIPELGYSGKTRVCEGCKETYNGPGGISELQAKLGLGTSARMSSSIMIPPVPTSPGSNDAPPPGLTVPPPPERPAAGPSSDDVKNQRYFVVREFVDTEESYVRSLDLILSKFLMPCRVQKLLPLLEFGEIFSNVEIVAMANTDLSKDLRTVFQEAQTAQASTEETYPDVSIGYTFLNHVRQLIPIYTPYCLNQTKAVATYE